MFLLIPILVFYILISSRIYSASIYSRPPDESIPVIVAINSRIWDIVCQLERHYKQHFIVTPEVTFHCSGKERDRIKAHIFNQHNTSIKPIQQNSFITLVLECRSTTSCQVNHIISGFYYTKSSYFGTRS